MSKVVVKAKPVERAETSQPGAEALAATEAGEIQTGKSPKKKKGKLGEELGLLALKVLIVAAFVFVIFTFFFGIARVGDESMLPAVKEGDLCIYYRLDTDYKKDDLCVLERDGVRQVRRVVAVPGDTVDITEDGLVINGYTQLEQGIYTDTLPYVDGTEFPITVGDSQVFLLGDNRPNSEDSRNYGVVNVDDTDGRVVTQLRRRGF